MPFLPFPDPLSIATLALRLAVGTVFLVHGPPKWRHPEGLAQGTGLPVWFGKFLGAAETLGGAALVLGFLTNLAAIGLSLVMLGALSFHLFRWKTPFTSPGKAGWEYDLTLLAACTALVALGGGELTLANILGWA